MIETLKKIVAETVESFEELTDMKRMTSSPESFNTIYRNSAEWLEDGLNDVEEETDFHPVFFRELEDTTLFAEMNIGFLNHPNGGRLSAMICCGFKTNPDGVEYYEPSAYADLRIFTQKGLYASCFIEDELKDAPETEGNITVMFENAIIDFMTENPAIFTAKTEKDLPKKPEPETEIYDEDIPF